MKFYLFVFAILFALNGSCQAIIGNRYCISDDKVFLFGKEIWAAREFISIEPSISHAVCSLTICKREAGDTEFTSYTGYRRFFYVDEEEFKCLENIFRYSLGRPIDLSPTNDSMSFGYEFYLHTPHRYEAEFICKKGLLNTALTIILERIACPNNCLMPLTKKMISPYIKEQLEYIDIYSKKRN